MNRDAGRPLATNLIRLIGIRSRIVVNGVELLLITINYCLCRSDTCERDVLEFSFINERDRRSHGKARVFWRSWKKYNSTIVLSSANEAWDHP